MKEVKPKFPVGTLVRVKNNLIYQVYDDNGETTRGGLYNSSSMLKFQGHTYHVRYVERVHRDDKSFWLYLIGEQIFHYAESMLEPYERKEVLL